MIARGGLLALAIVLGACGGQIASDARYPKRPEGCDVTLYRAQPTVATDNIGPVSAVCGEDIAADDCVRTLKDQACKLGGDVVWGVDDPVKKDGKVFYNGRAAHTRAPRGAGHT